jgi:hypothetical protein
VEVEWICIDLALRHLDPQEMILTKVKKEPDPQLFKVLWYKTSSDML